jgi:lysophospholipase L1-like esterase
MAVMRPIRAGLAVVSGAAVLGATVLARQVWRTVHRPDLPSLANQDISGTFGDHSLPLLRIVAVGDSSLTAPGIEDPDDAWLRRLARGYAGRHRVELRSLGVGGSVAGDVVAGPLAAAVALQPDVAVVSIGGNDVIRAVSLRGFAVSLDRIVSRLEGASGAVVLIGVGDLGAIPRLPPLLRPLLSRRSALFDRACARVAATHERTVKTQARRPGDATFRGDLSLFAADQFHASAAGHAMFATATAPAFEVAYRLAMVGRTGPPVG